MKLILQLNPMLPFDTPKGMGWAFALIDYTQDHDTLYKIIITETREVWDFPQSQVRGVKNISFGRVAEPTPLSPKAREFTKEPYG